MKGSIGVPTQTFGTIIPHLWKLAKIVNLSDEGKRRLKWIDHYLQKRNVCLTCRHYDLPRSLFYKWFNRYKRLGVRGLESAKRRPHNVRKREILWDVQNKIETLRRENPAWSKYKIAHILRRDEGILVSSSSVNRIFHDRELFWESPISKAQLAAKRAWKIKRLRVPLGLRGAAPGSLVEIDLKVLNNLGRTFYQFTAIDTCTKIKFIQIYSAKTARLGQKFIQAMLAFYPFRVRHIHSDNGGEFLAECHAFLESKKITHYFSRARTPQDNPMVENTIKADEYEFWAWGNLAGTVKELNIKAQEWMNKFNTYRPHQALNYLTPMEYYESNFT
mgnify:FL=1